MADWSLPPRLQLIADWVPLQAIIQDVGTDHGLVPLFLLSHKKISKAYATDLRLGPLHSIYSHPLARKFENALIIQQHDGILNDVPEINCVIIAGIGGGVITSILNKGLTQLGHVDHLILQPQNETYQIRRFLSQNHFKILKEVMVLDHNIIYEIIHAVPGEQHLSDKEITFGPILLKEHSTIFIQYWEAFNNHLITIKNQLPSTQKTRQIELELQIKEVEDVLHENT